MTEELKQEAYDNRILEIRCGSHMYGTSVPESDEDFAGVFLPPKEYILGTRTVKEFDFGFKDKDESGKNTKDAIDRKLYEFRHFCKLAKQNNPTILELLFVTEDNIVYKDEAGIGQGLLDNRHLFPSKECGRGYTGYAKAQMHKMQVKTEKMAELKEGLKILQDSEDKEVMADMITKYPETFTMRKGDMKLIWCGDLQFERGTFVKKARKAVETRIINGTNRQELMDKYGYDCYSEDTEFLTEGGWKLYDEIETGEKLGTLNPETKELEFQSYYERVKKKINTEMYKLSGKYTSALVTKNHRMFTSKCVRNSKTNFSTSYEEEKSDWGFRSLKEIAEEKGSHYHIVSLPLNRNKEYNITDSELELVGAFVTEGTINFRSGKPKCAIISQTTHGKQEFIDRMDAITTSEEYKGIKKYKYDRPEKELVEYRWHTTKEEARKLYKSCGHMSAKKRLPRWKTKLSKRQAELLLNMLYLGDGTNYKDSIVYYTKSRQLAVDVQIIAMLSERRSSCLLFDGMWQVRIEKESKKINCITINPSLRKYNKNGSLDDRGGHYEEYKGNIVCFSVPNETLITRHNGRIAIHGNTKFAMHFIRLLEEGLEVLRTGEIAFPLSNREHLLDIRLGKYTLAEVLEMGQALKEMYPEAEEKSVLPAVSPMDEIEEYIVKTMLSHVAGS